MHKYYYHWLNVFLFLFVEMFMFAVGYFSAKRFLQIQGIVLVFRVLFLKRLTITISLLCQPFLLCVSVSSNVHQRTYFNKRTNKLLLLFVK